MVVLINDKTTYLFKVYKGLRQGCALSPLLFILVMDAISRNIIAMKEYGQITGCKTSRNYEMTHLMFVDDVLCVGANEITQWETFHKIFDKFGKAFGLIINSSKTELITND